MCTSCGDGGRGAWFKTHHNALCTCMVFDEKASELSLNVSSVTWWSCGFLHFNPVFVWEECLEMSGSLTPMKDTWAQRLKCWHQQLEGRGGWRAAGRGGEWVVLRGNRLLLVNKNTNIKNHCKPKVSGRLTHQRHMLRSFSSQPSRRQSRFFLAGQENTGLKAVAELLHQRA